MTSYDYNIVDSCMMSFNLNCIMPLKQLYNIVTKVSSRQKCYYFWWSTWLLRSATPLLGLSGDPDNPTKDLEAHSYEVHSKDTRSHIHGWYKETSCALVMEFLWSSHEVHMKFKSFEIQMNFIFISCEMLMSLMSTLVLHGYNISTSLVLRYEVHMNFIRTAYKFIWINLISFDMKFIRISYELHTKLIWTSRKFHMNKFDFISYEIHEKFIWTSYKGRMTLTIKF